MRLAAVRAILCVKPLAAPWAGVMRAVLDRLVPPRRERPVSVELPKIETAQDLERREGRLEFRGPSTTRGYFHNEAKTKELIRTGWLDSGDRAYMAGGDVYVTGRVKDCEEEVAGIPGVHKGGVAVFGVVAKRELSTQRVAGPLLRRLGIPFVERYDVSGSLADAERLIDLARRGRLLVFFPEGTFTRRAGLSGFYMGAFKVAAEASLPILPGVIRGTRSMLRGDQWFPRRASVKVEIGEPVQPSGTDFASLLRLRDDVRKSILSRCGEPDLVELIKPEQAQPTVR